MLEPTRVWSILIPLSPKQAFAPSGRQSEKQSGQQEQKKFGDIAKQERHLPIEADFGLSEKNIEPEQEEQQRKYSEIGAIQLSKPVVVQHGAASLPLPAGIASHSNAARLLAVGRCLRPSRDQINYSGYTWGQVNQSYKSPDDTQIRGNCTSVQPPMELYPHCSPPTAENWTSKVPANVRLWLQADLQASEIDFCFTPNNGHSEAHAGLPLLTQPGHLVRCTDHWTNTNPDSS